MNKSVLLLITFAFISLFLRASHAKLSGVGLLMFLPERQLVLPGVIFHIVASPKLRSQLLNATTCYARKKKRLNLRHYFHLF